MFEQKSNKWNEGGERYNDEYTGVNKILFLDNEDFGNPLK